MLPRIGTACCAPLTRCTQQEGRTRPVSALRAALAQGLVDATCMHSASCLPQGAGQGCCGVQGTGWPQSVRGAWALRAGRPWAPLVSGPGHVACPKSLPCRVLPCSCGVWSCSNMMTRSARAQARGAPRMRCMSCAASVSQGVHRCGSRACCRVCRAWQELQAVLGPQLGEWVAGRLVCVGAGRSTAIPRPWGIAGAALAPCENLVPGAGTNVRARSWHKGAEVTGSSSDGA